MWGLINFLFVTPTIQWAEFLISITTSPMHLHHFCPLLCWNATQGKRFLLFLQLVQDSSLSKTSYQLLLSAAHTTGDCTEPMDFLSSAKSSLLLLTHRNLPQLLEWAGKYLQKYLCYRTRQAETQLRWMRSPSQSRQAFRIKKQEKHTGAKNRKNTHTHFFLNGMLGKDIQLCTAAKHQPPVSLHSQAEFWTLKPLKHSILWKVDHVELQT